MQKTDEEIRQLLYRRAMRIVLSYSATENSSIAHASQSLAKRAERRFPVYESADPLKVLSATEHFFFTQTTSLVCANRMEEAILWHKEHVKIKDACVQLEKLLEEKNAPQKRGGKKRHEKTDFIKAGLIQEIGRMEGSKRSMRSIALSLMPVADDLASEINHKFPNWDAAFQFVYKIVRASYRTASS